MPEAKNPQALNRYSYAYNNPLRYSDPSGHSVEDWFDDSWHQEFSQAHGGASPTAGDYAYRFISMAVASGMGGGSGGDSGGPVGGGGGENPGGGLDLGSAGADGNGVPRTPDYYTLTLNAGGLFGLTGTVTINRFGQVFVGAGGNFGKSLREVTVSSTGGYLHLFDLQMPRKNDGGNEVGDFNKGWCINAAIGAGTGMSMTWNPPMGGWHWVGPTEGGWKGWNESLAAEWGLYLPQIGVSATYSWQVYGPP